MWGNGDCSLWLAGWLFGLVEYILFTLSYIFFSRFCFQWLDETSPTFPWSTNREQRKCLKIWKIIKTIYALLINYSLYPNLIILIRSPNFINFKHVKGLLKFALEFYCNKILDVLSSFGKSPKCVNLPEKHKSLSKLSRDVSS